MLVPWNKRYDKPRQHIKKQRHHSADKRPYSQSYGLSSSHVWMWELGHKEGWGPEDWGFWTVMLEKTQGDQISQSSKSNQKSTLNIHWKDMLVEAPILWPPTGKSWLVGKDPDAEKDWRREKGATEHEMVGWHHRLSGHEFEQTLGDSEGHGSLLCYSPWGCKELDTT